MKYRYYIRKKLLGNLLKGVFRRVYGKQERKE